MKTYRNTNWTKRNYECTNVVACQAETMPKGNWEECSDLILVGLTQLWVETVGGVRMTMFGYL